MKTRKLPLLRKRWFKALLLALIIWLGWVDLLHSQTQPIIPSLSDSRASQPPSKDKDHLFTTGMMGLLPFVSGFYVTEKKDLGLVFTALDLALVGGIYNALTTEMQDKGNVSNYLIAMGAVNLLDMWLSSRQARADLESRIKLIPAGPSGYGPHMTFSFNP